MCFEIYSLLYPPKQYFTWQSKKLYLISLGFLTSWGMEKGDLRNLPQFFLAIGFFQQATKINYLHKKLNTGVSSFFTSNVKDSLKLLFEILRRKKIARSEKLFKKKIETGAWCILWLQSTWVLVYISLTWFWVTSQLLMWLHPAYSEPLKTTAGIYGSLVSPIPVRRWRVGNASHALCHASVQHCRPELMTELPDYGKCVSLFHQGQ